ncbi:Oidioi.mRNA.OKI2018_I69.chr2.g7828.t1.cds [Oikopleura dioica]|uniref:Dolichyl-diphosphooligosaccharide--protein glycosyltransferase subunit 2 n=1 Tax=Oikopleura dioica TaxID=34765 RepID=A0ABN7T7F3_OIKDI|nr:Oidioi.mRNA.OKI2018_I69.chr2.g7828.t1.cds [Oikopleura dioica]
MKLLGWVFLASATASLAGVVTKDILKTLYFQSEQNAKSIKDLYYISLMNPEHEGIDTARTCPMITAEADRTIEQLYHTMFITKMMKDLAGKKECKYSVTSKDEDLISANMENPANVKDFFNAINLEILLQNGFDGQVVVDTFGKLLEKDDSVLAVTLVMRAVIQLWSQNNQLNLDSVAKHVDIADLVAQADAFDNELSFNNEFAATSNFLSAAFSWAEYTGRFELSDDQLLGFSNFFVNNFPEDNTARFYAFEAFSFLIKNKYKTPCHVAWISRKPFVSANMPLVAQIMTINGEAAEVQVSVKSMTHVESNEVYLSNSKFSLHAPNEEGWMEKDFSDNTMFPVVFEHQLPTNLIPGYYDVELEVTGGNYITGNNSIRQRIKVPHSIALKNARIAYASKSSVEKKWHTTIPNDGAIGSDGKITVEFEVVNEQTSESLTAHQAFVVFYNTHNDVETTFIAEKKKSKYVASVDVSGNLEFGGKNQVKLIVGDALFHPAIKTHDFGTLLVNGIPEPDAGNFNDRYLDKYDPPAEIHHTFREPEARPPVMISFVFTGLCALPLVGLVVVWSRLGVNLRRMESAFLPFHIAIASIFGLYFLYWLRLDMFTTLKYLALLGSATFILGNRVLSTLAGKPK